MLKAIILVRGDVNIYTLEKNGKKEVTNYIITQSNDPQYGAFVQGLTSIINIIALERGYDVPSEWFKCWKPRKKGENFCEIRKGPLRIGCFKYGDKLLLCTLFKKTKQNQKEEYDRAINLKKQFDIESIWEA